MEIQDTRRVVTYLGGARMRRQWRFHCSCCNKSGAWGKLADARHLGVGHIELFHPVVVQSDRAAAF